jgi:hypothetical protein
MPVISVSKAFVRDLKRLGSKQRQNAARDAIVKFAGNPHHSGLNFERVLSRPGFHTIRATLGDRILLLKAEARDDYTAVAVGDHDYIYRAYFKRR